MKRQNGVLVHFSDAEYARLKEHADKADLDVCDVVRFLTLRGDVKSQTIQRLA